MRPGLGEGPLGTQERIKSKSRSLLARQGARSQRSRTREPTVLVAVVLAAIVCALEYAATSGLPYFSEDYSLQARAEGYTSFREVIDPRVVPFRPLQNVFLLGMERLRLAPWAARILPFALALVSFVLVAGFVRRLGGSRRAAAVAVLLAAAFPWAKATIYVCAIGNPGRVAAVLLGLYALAGMLRAPSRRDGALLLVSMLLALGFHQTGAVLILGIGAFAVLAELSGEVPGETRRPALWKSPWLLAAAGSGIVYTVGMFLLFHGSYPRSSPLAIASNLVRAAFALVPEALRYPAVEGLRGHAGAWGRLYGLLALAGVATAFVWAWRRADAIVHVLLTLVVADLALHAVAAGFVIRYAPLAGALAGCIVGLAIDRCASARARGLALAAAVGLGLAWARDAWIDVEEYRSAGRVVEAVLEDASAKRAEVGSGPAIALVDLPYDHGREQDIPLFQWGTAWALERRGAPGPWRLLTTSTNTAFQADFVSGAELRALVRDEPGRVLVFDAATERLREPAP